MGQKILRQKEIRERMSSSEEEEERRDRFRRERFEEKDSLERKRRRDDDEEKEENRSDKEEKRRKVDDETSKYKEISFFDKHWKAEWFQRMFNPIERKKARNEREQNAKNAMMEFKNDDFEETSYEFETSPLKEQEESILILSDVPEEMSSEMFKEWIFEKLKDEKNLVKDIVFSNPLKRPRFERYALLRCENESALKSVQRLLSGVTMSFKSRNREVFRRIVVEEFRVSPVPKMILPTTKRSHERLLLDLHQALSLSDALDQLRNLDFTLRDYLERHHLPSADESDGFQTMRILDICIEWLLRVHRWAYYSNCSFEQDGDLILARNEKYVRPKNTSQTDELKNVVVKASDYKDVDESKFDVGFVNLMKSLDRSVVSEREAKWDALEQDFLKEFEEEKNQEDTLRKITFQAFSTLCHEKDKIMSLENSSTTRRHPRRNNNRSSGGVMVPAPYFQRQHNGRMRFKDPDAVSSSSPLLSSQKRRGGGKSTTPKKMDFDDF